MPHGHTPVVNLVKRDGQDVFWGRVVQASVTIVRNRVSLVKGLANFS